MKEGKEEYRGLCYVPVYSEGLLEVAANVCEF